MGAKRDPWPCVGCGRMMLGRGLYRQQPHPRQYARHEACDLCNACYQREHQRPAVNGVSGESVPRAAAVSEWAFLHESGQLNTGDSRAKRIRQAAPRIGMTAAALEKALERAGVAA